MFYSIKELVEQADLDFQRKCRRTHDCDRISTNRSGTPEVLLLMERNLEVMKASVELGLSENKSVVA